ncbi:MAG: hydroxyacylglutathione hydrolase [Pseudobacteriovorax sp.]|nr:hydroxyacylglutathione hydrolase [Pseudobacteriovorax sp.]
MVVELNVDVIPVWDDNYVFAVRLPESVWIIDPADFSTVDGYLKSKDLTPTTILNTHHHFDHVGGNEDFKKAYDLEIWANVNDKARIPGHTKAVTPGQSYLLDGVNIEVIDVPGHTIGHIAYFLPDHKILFAGDTLFSLGCGRLFEGTPAQMLSSLSLLKSLPSETMVYAAHEYTLANGKFAETVEPENQDLRLYLQQCQDMRALGQPTIPFNLGHQELCNPFLRTSVDRVQEFAGPLHCEIQVFGAIRRAKDSF